MPTKQTDQPTTPEEIVRLYLLTLADPDAYRQDHTEQFQKELAAAEAKAAKAKDPLDKLLALAEVDKVAKAWAEKAKRKVNPFEDAFIETARQFAIEHSISFKNWRALKVPIDVLNRAGIYQGTTSANRRTSTGGRRAPQLSSEDVLAAVPPGEFKLADLAVAIEREPATTRNYLNKLVGLGKVKVIGDDPKHSGKGKAAKVYRKS